MWNPDSRKLSLVKSGILDLESEILAKDSRMPLTIGIRNLSSTDKKSRLDSSFDLIYRDPSDFGSPILIRIISKERTPRLSWIADSQLRCLGSAMTLKEVQGLFSGGNSHMKVAGMLVVLLRSVNFRFWTRLGRGVLGKTPSYLAAKVSFRVALEEIIYFQFVLFTRFM